MKTIAERLKWIRAERGFDRAVDAARAFGWKESTYLGHENDDRRPGRETASRYSKAFKIPVGWLLSGEGSPKVKPAFDDVPLVGKIGANAGADVVLFGEGSGYIGHELPSPPNRTAGTKGLEVEGDSMRGTAKDGWIVYFDDQDVRNGDLDSLIGEICVCWLADGRVLLKELQYGRSGDGLFDLESMNAPTLRDQVVERATRVTAIVPRGRRPKGDHLVKPGDVVGRLKTGVKTKLE